MMHVLLYLDDIFCVDKPEYMSVCTSYQSVSGSVLAKQHMLQQ